MRSEVAQLRQQLVDEYQAGKQALSGLAYGTARHDFITQHMENMERCQIQLEALVGSEQATQIVNESLTTQ